MEYDKYKPHKLRQAENSPSLAYIQQGIGCPDSFWPKLKEVFRIAAKEWIEALKTPEDLE